MIYKAERKVFEDTIPNSAPSRSENGGGVSLTEAHEKMSFAAHGATDQGRE